MRKDIVSESAAPYGERARLRVGDAPWLRRERWTESQYLALDTNNLIEFDNGVLEILPMPDFVHQSISFLLARLFLAYSEAMKPGFVVQAPFRLKIPNGKYREADLLFLFEEHAHQFANDYWSGADVAVEIVSPDGEKRDWIDKRADYALAGIAEYWIIEPKTKSVTVLKLNGKKYSEHGVFQTGESVTSAILSGFKVPVDTLFAARFPAIKR